MEGFVFVAKYDSGAFSLVPSKGRGFCAYRAEVQSEQGTIMLKSTCTGALLPWSFVPFISSDLAGKGASRNENKLSRAVYQF